MHQLHQNFSEMSNYFIDPREDLTQYFVYKLKKKVLIIVKPTHFIIRSES